ncbi:MAG: hypothetical protein HY902_11920 [Deltaproteobacteria bacterium]|nr:hypothetical protein [Deltaproteobacteria bacterium]
MRYLWEDGTWTDVALGTPHELDLRGTLLAGGQILGQTAPNASPRGLLSIRLLLAQGSGQGGGSYGSQAPARVSDPGSSYGWHSVVVGAGPEDSGYELDLQLPAGTVIAPGRPIQLTPIANQQPAWTNTYVCDAQRWTVHRLIRVDLLP